MRQRASGEHGAAAVEMAFLLPILAMLLFGILQFGLAMWRTSTIESAAREGGRLASVGGSVTEVTDRVHAAATGFDGATELIVTTTGCTVVGDDVEVTVSTVAGVERLQLSIPFWEAPESGVSYEAVATFRCERTMAGAS